MFSGCGKELCHLRFGINNNGLCSESSDRGDGIEGKVYVYQFTTHQYIGIDCFPFGEGVIFDVIQMVQGDSLFFFGHIFGNPLITSCFHIAFINPSLGCMRW